jgi:hypothetical protein
MPFSLGSYLLGVGTIVGALAFGLGSGVLLTNTAMKEPAAAPTRVERVARSEPGPPAQQDTKENPAPPAEAAPAAHPDSAPTVQAATPQFDAPGEAESAKQPQPMKQAELAKPRKSANQAEQREALQKKTAERKVDRQKHYTEQKAKPSFAASRTRQPPSEQQDQPERTGFWLGRKEPHFDLFPTPSPPPFARSYDWAPFDRDD